MSRSHISRRTFCAGAVGAPALLGVRPSRPNILLVMTDQQRWDSLGCYGFHGIRTPSLDRLAADGTLFEHCYANNPICTPSRASLFTGKSVPGHGVYKLYDNLPNSEMPFTKRLQQAGYHTALFGKLHLSGRLYEAGHRHPNDGFDVYEWCIEPSIHLESPLNGYARWLQETDPEFLKRLRVEGRRLLHVPQRVHMTHWAAERTIDFIRRSDARRPFFCYMSVFDPHNPYDGYPDEFGSLVDMAKVPEASPAPPGPEPEPYAVRHHREHGYAGRSSDIPREKIRSMRRGYFASIALADHEIGRVLTALEEKGIAGNTLVIFTSDHGDMLGDRGLFVKGAFFYDACIRVPLLMRRPETLPKGARISGPVQLHDLAATILASAGCLDDAAREAMPESQDLAAVAKGGDRRGSAVCCYRNTGIFSDGQYANPEIHATMLRDARHKLSLYHRPQARAGDIEGELYDMRDDPAERRNLWHSAAAGGVRSRMTARLAAWLASQEQGSRGGEILPSREQKLDNRLR